MFVTAIFGDLVLVASIGMTTGVGAGVQIGSRVGRARCRATKAIHWVMRRSRHGTDAVPNGSRGEA